MLPSAAAQAVLVHGRYVQEKGLTTHHDATRGGNGRFRGDAIPGEFEGDVAVDLQRSLVTDVADDGEAKVEDGIAVGDIGREADGVEYEAYASLPRVPPLLTGPLTSSAPPSWAFSMVVLSNRSTAGSNCRSNWKPWMLSKLSTVTGTQKAFAGQGIFEGKV
jgi:hypothetical protein